MVTDATLFLSSGHLHTADGFFMVEAEECASGQAFERTFIKPGAHIGQAPGEPGTD
jgi:hypothetical protein